MTTPQPSASSSVEINASPASVYALVTDLTAMSEIAEETAVMRWQKGSAAAPGAVFKGTNRNGWRRWTTKCTITDADPGTRFAFNVSHTGVPISRWQYDISAVEGGCSVTESTWDRRPGWYKTPAGLVTGIMNRAGANADHIQATLQRLKSRAEASPAK
ncbi:MAG TPA: SRPBCC family protein [Jatrophihabitantaceae bacterium]|nr:SRPBCC family protein [Jatrophihabitantaceae bacterium]